jgi:hypothetical protein
MRLRRLRARLHIYVKNYQWHGYKDMSMFVDDTTLKNAPAS